MKKLLLSLLLTSCIVFYGQYDFDVAIERKKQIQHDHPATQNSKFKIKELNIHDPKELEQLLALNNILRNAGETTISYTLPGSKVKFTTLIAQSNDGVFCGGIGYTPKKEHVWIGTLAVHPDYRRQGIATQLVQEVEKRNTDKQELRLLVDQSNSKAMSTYDKLGFDQGV